MTNKSVLSESNILVAENPMEQAELAAAMFAAQVGEVLLEKQYFDSVLSGGSSPVPFFLHLAAYYKDKIEWNRIRFFWADERNVPPDHPESNYRLAFDTFLRPLQVPSENIYRIPTPTSSSQAPGGPEGGAREAAESYERSLRALFDPVPAFDHVLLGLGNDGHTASLFPDARADWDQAEREGRWVASFFVPHLNAYRITLLPSVLNQGTKICFLVSGEEKSKILRQVLRFDEPAGPKLRSLYPAELIHSRTGKPFWLLDRAAAAKLDLAQAA